MGDRIPATACKSSEIALQLNADLRNMNAKSAKQLVNMGINTTTINGYWNSLNALETESGMTFPNTRALLVQVIEKVLSAQHILWGNEGNIEMVRHIETLAKRFGVEIEKTAPEAIVA